jgi:hypothetical protein
MYIDPNTGGMLFQVLAAFLAVFSGMALVFSSRIRAFVARLRRNKHNQAEESQLVEPTQSSEE